MTWRMFWERTALREASGEECCVCQQMFTGRRKAAWNEPNGIYVDTYPGSLSPGRRVLECDGQARRFQEVRGYDEKCLEMFGSANDLALQVSGQMGAETISEAGWDIDRSSLRYKITSRAKGLSSWSSTHSPFT